VGVCLFAGNADHRQVQVATDGLSDVPEWHALLADSVQSQASRGFRGQPEQARRVESVHGRPTVRSVADER
jgi:hypothetical protein